MDIGRIPPDWYDALSSQFDRPYWTDLSRFVAAERERHTVYPAAENVFRALELTPLSSVKCIILGQDPYHGVGQAHGLAFSVQAGCSIPPSLRNILKELEADLGIATTLAGPRGRVVGDLTPWAERGVLLLNTCLTVRAKCAGSHAHRGWERFTDVVLAAVVKRQKPTAFVLWGAQAQRVGNSIPTCTPHFKFLKVESPHPSPLSAKCGFFGSKPFSRVNAYLEAHGIDPIDWRLSPPSTLSTF